MSDQGYTTEEMEVRNDEVRKAISSARFRAVSAELTAIAISLIILVMLAVVFIDSRLRDGDQGVQIQGLNSRVASLEAQATAIAGRPSPTAVSIVAPTAIPQMRYSIIVTRFAVNDTGAFRLEMSVVKDLNGPYTDHEVARNALTEIMRPVAKSCSFSHGRGLEDSALLESTYGNVPISQKCWDAFFIATGGQIPSTMFK